MILSTPRPLSDFDECANSCHSCGCWAMAQVDPLPSFPISPIRAEDARKGRRRYGQPCGRVQIRGELEPRLGAGEGRQMPLR